MDSKMKPLWLVWKNAELAAGTKQFESFVMFKKGDGTRVLLVLNNLQFIYCFVYVLWQCCEDIFTGSKNVTPFTSPITPLNLTN